MEPAGSTAGEDRALMERIAGGDRSAFRTLVEAHQRGVLDLGCRMLRDAGEAEDLCQEVFLKVLQKAADFRGEGPLRGWVFRIAVNRALNVMRRARPSMAEDPDGEPGPGEAPPAILERNERARQVREAVEALPERQRMAVVLLRYEKLSYREIAEALECGLSAVVSLIHRAHETLREKLKKLQD
ncbi:MAG: RNA polymerase sigma factor [Planctomycetota bacterium]